MKMVEGEGMGLLPLVLGASLPVQIVLVILLAASVVSWTMIFRKLFQLRVAQAQAAAFEKRFWAGGNVAQMHQEMQKATDRNVGMAAIFSEGYQEFRRLAVQGGADPTAVVEGVQRAMRVALQREMDWLETHLSFLATVGSTSPYVGLLGTVWGIMNAFRSLGGLSQVTIAHVAPGIAEALIATAIGLFAAIPAVVAYNRYSHHVDRLVSRYEIFMDEFAAIVHRQALAAGRP